MAGHVADSVYWFDFVDLTHKNTGLPPVSIFEWSIYTTTEKHRMNVSLTSRVYMMVFG